MSVNVRPLTDLDIPVPVVKRGLCLCFQEDLGEHVVQGDAHPGHVGTACLLSSSFLESGKDIGLVTLPIMGRNSRQTIGKVKGKGETAGAAGCRRQGSDPLTVGTVSLLPGFQWTTW